MEVEKWVDVGPTELSIVWDYERGVYRVRLPKPPAVNRRRTIATVAKMLVDDKTIPGGERLAGALMQMLGAGGAKPYEVEE